MITVVVQTFVIDPIWKSESIVDSTPVSRLRTPDAAALISSSRRTASEAPGTACLPTSSSSRSARDVLAIASDMKLLLSGGLGRDTARRRRREMTERAMKAPVRAVARILLEADPPLGVDRRADRAARVEVTAGRRSVRIRWIAELQVRRAHSARSPEPRHRAEQRLGVRMLRRRHDGFRGPDLDDASEVHDGQRVAD